MESWLGWPLSGRARACPHPSSRISLLSHTHSHLTLTLAAHALAPCWPCWFSTHTPRHPHAHPDTQTLRATPGIFPHLETNRGDPNINGGAMYGVTRGGEDRPDKPKRGNSCSRDCQAAVAPSSAWRSGIVAAGVGECHPSRQDRRRPRLAATFGLQGLLVSYFGRWRCPVSFHGPLLQGCSMREVGIEGHVRQAPVLVLAPCCSPCRAAAPIASRLRLPTRIYTNQHARRGSVSL